VAADLKVEVTGILEELSQETPDPKISPEQLLPLVYDALRGRARSQLRRERADHTLQATELVHEAYERLAEAPSASHSEAWQTRPVRTWASRSSSPWTGP
jgi:hypothetical protein